MPLKLQEFVSQVADDTIRKSRFEITFNRIPFVVQNLDFRNLTLRCDSASLPGMQILTKDYTLYHGMPAFKIPNGRAYDDIDFEFISSGNLTEKKILEEWVHQISDLRRNTVNYIEDISADITISVYNDNSNVSVYEAKLLYAYPIRIDTTAISWQNTDELLKVATTFTYQQIQFLKAESYSHNGNYYA